MECQHFIQIKHKNQYQIIMEKHTQINLDKFDGLIPKNKHIFTETKNDQQLISNDINIEKKVKNNNKCIQEEINDFGYNIDKYKHNNSNYCVADEVTEHVDQYISTIKIEKDVYNGYEFESEIEIEMPSINVEYYDQVTKKMVHSANPIEYFFDDGSNVNDDCPTVSEQLHNEKIQHQCNICNKQLHDKYNLEIHKSFHANIKEFKCTTCDKKFLNLNGLKSHLISHIDNSIELIESQFVQQECNRIDIDECNSNLCNNITTLEGLNTSYNNSGVPMKNEIIKKITLGFSVEIKLPRTENIISTKVYNIDSKNSVVSDLNVENAVNSVAVVHHKSVDVAESFNASSVNSVDVAESFNASSVKSVDVAEPFNASSVKSVDVAESFNASLVNSVDVVHHKSVDVAESFNASLVNFVAVVYHKSVDVAEPFNASSVKSVDVTEPFNASSVNSVDVAESFNASFKCHKRVHNAEKPYKCNICGDEFTQLIDWKKYRKTHYDDTIFKCNNCHKKFASKTGLRVHLERHKERVKEHTCKICNKKFLNKNNLFTHEKIHKDF